MTKAKASIQLAYKEMLTQEGARDAPFGGSGGPLCSYGRVSPKGRVKTENNAPCHASLQHWDSCDVEVFYNWHRHHTAPTYNRAWVKFLLSKQSPWRAVTGASPPITVKGKLINSPRFVLKHGFILYNLDVPANLMVNFLIASRAAYEHPKQIKWWKWLVDAGIHPAVAFFFCGQVHSRVSKRYTLNWTSYGHWALNEDGCDKDYFKNFCTGTVVRPSKLFSESTSYRPCNKVWGTPDMVDRHDYAEYFDGAYGKQQKTITVPSAFGGKPRVVKSYTKRKLIQCISKEQRRIGL